MRPTSYTFPLLLLLAAGACASGGATPSAGDRAGRHAAPAEPPIPLVPPAPTVTIVLGHTTDLGITDAQRVQLVAIRRRIDSVDAPLRTTLDSLRPAGRPVNPRDLGPDQRDDIRRRRLAAENVVAHFRDNNLTSRAEVMAVLSADQQERVAALEEDARRHEAEVAQGASGEDRGMGTGRRGGRGGRSGSGRP